MAGELDEIGNKLKLPGRGDKTKWIMVAIGFGTLVITWLLYKHARAQSAAATPSASQTAAASGIDPATGLPIGSGAGAFGTSGTPNGFSDLNGQLSQLIASEGALTTAVQALTQPPQGAGVGMAVTPSFTDVSTERLIGSGYSAPAANPSGYINTPQGIFSWIPSTGIVASILGSGGTVYTQPTPGNFLPVLPGAAPDLPGTPVFAQLPSIPQGILGADQTPGVASARRPVTSDSGHVAIPAMGGYYGVLRGAPNPTNVGGTSRVIR